MILCEKAIGISNIWKRFNHINYIVRYTSRPVLAQSRITDYTGNHVTFTYTPHGADELITETLHVFDFNKKLIIHIPERNFKMIRYQGFYLKRKRKQYLQHQRRLQFAEYSRTLAIHGSWRKRILFYFSYDPLKCIYCGATLELFCDHRKIKYYFTIYNRWKDPYLERLNYYDKG